MSDSKTASEKKKKLMTDMLASSVLYRSASIGAKSKLLECFEREINKHSKKSDVRGFLADRKAMFGEGLSVAFDALWKSNGLGIVDFFSKPDAESGDVRKTVLALSEHIENRWVPDTLPYEVFWKDTENELFESPLSLNQEGLSLIFSRMEQEKNWESYFRISLFLHYLFDGLSKALEKSALQATRKNNYVKPKIMTGSSTHRDYSYDDWSDYLLWYLILEPGFGDVDHEYEHVEDVRFREGYDGETVDGSSDAVGIAAAAVLVDDLTDIPSEAEAGAYS